MSGDDYLWDGSGEPDPEVARLEKLLSPYRYEQPLRVAFVAPRSARFKKLVAIAAALIVVAGTLIVLGQVRLRWTAGRAWDVAAVEGSATINGKTISPNDALRVGDVLRTDAASRVTVRVARIGKIDLGPSTVARLVSTRSTHHRLALEAGSVSARIWAPPFSFGIDTPAGLASDLGCAFTLQFGQGAGTLLVTSGWVDFDGPNRSSVVPAGAVAELRIDGPGTPYWTDASEDFRDAVREYDSEPGPAALGAVVSHARPRDAMSLLHIMERATPEEREFAFDQVAAIAPLPPGVTRERIVAGDMRAHDQWRESVGLRGIKRWWLNWRDALPR